MDQTLQRPRVLVYDDDQIFLAHCERTLQKREMEVVRGDPNDIAAGFSRIAACKPNVILTDLYVGNMDLAQFIFEARRQTTDQDLHFIMLASYNSKNLFQECCEAGAAYCMIKPIDFNILADRIRKICDVKRTTTLNSPSRLVALEPASLEAQVTQIIQQIGIPAHIKGYSYIRFAIITAVKDPSAIELITKILYPMIAREFETTATRVERAIRHAIEVTWDCRDAKQPQELFGYIANRTRRKPTNSEFIALVADTLRMQNQSMVSSL